MKIKFLLVWLFFFATSAFAQYGENNNFGVFLHTSIGASTDLEPNFEFELGVRAPTNHLFFSVPAGVFVSKTSNDQKSHAYLGIRANYLIYINETTAIGPIITGLKHWTGESNKFKSNDYDIGIRFYRLSPDPSRAKLRSGGFTLTARYLSTQGNVYNKQGDDSLEPVSKFILSIGFHGLF